MVGAAACAVVGLLVVPTANAGSPGPTISLGKSGGLEYLTAEFLNVASPASTPAECSPNRFVTGGGAVVSGPTEEGRVTATAPLSTAGQGWEGAGRSISGASKTVDSYAICSKSEPVYVSGSAGITAGTTVGLSPACQPDEHVTGGGVSANGGDIEILESNPVDSMSDPDTKPDDGWETRARNASGGNVTLTGYAVCSESLKTKYTFKTKPVDPGSAGKAKVSCPKGTVVSGGGLESPDAGVWAHDSKPIDSGDPKQVPDDGWSGRLHNPNLAASTVTVHAICVKG